MNRPDIKKLCKIFCLLIGVGGVIMLIVGMFSGKIELPSLKQIEDQAILTLKGRRTVNDVIELYGEGVRQRLQPYLLKAGFDSTPEQLALLALKQEQIVEVWGNRDNQWKKIKTYPFTATSGKLGPKLREGDRQIPEGLYRISYMNPNSSYHLSFKIDYPNAFDQTMAQQEGRTNLGGDIFLHGSDGSVGCIAIGDIAIEELFLLVHEVEMRHVKVIIAPVDFRNGAAKPEIPDIEWTQELYQQIEHVLKLFTDETSAM